MTGEVIIDESVQNKIFQLKYDFCNQTFLTFNYLF